MVSVHPHHVIKPHIVILDRNMPTIKASYRLEAMDGCEDYWSCTVVLGVKWILLFITAVLNALVAKPMPDNKDRDHCCELVYCLT